MNKKLSVGAITMAALFLAAPHAPAAVVVQPASVFLVPAQDTVNLADAITTLELVADFTDMPSVGGGVDFSISGPAAIQDFQPSPFFFSLADSSVTGCDTGFGFTGCGTLQAAGDFEVHWGAPFGFSGVNTIGTFTVALQDLGDVFIALSINPVYGSFFPVGGVEPMTVELLGAGFTVVPVPAAVWLFGSALGLVAMLRRRVRVD